MVFTKATVLTVTVLFSLAGYNGESLVANTCTLQGIKVNEVAIHAHSNMTFEKGDVLYYNGEGYECLEYGWRDSVKETASSTTAVHHSRHKRFIFALIGALLGVAVVATGFCIFFCKPPPPNKPPVFTVCPRTGKSYTADPGRRDTIVKWETPRARDHEDGDNLKIIMVPKIISGSRFREGVHVFSFRARDRAGAEANCHLRFEIKVKRCKLIEFPKDGSVKCEQPDFIYGSHCALTCREGYEISPKTKSNQQTIKCVLDSKNQPAYDVSVAKCKAIKCNENAQELKVKNGKPKCSNDQYEFNTNCVADCYKGFAQHDLSPTTCKSDKTWSKPLGSCYDIEPPVIKNCPSSFVIATERGSKQAYVEWETPTATDNAGLVYVNQTVGPSSGTYLDIGKHEISYQAVDEIGNNSTRPCIFQVEVYEQKCSPPFIDDKYLRYNCTSGYGFGASCQLSCLGTFPLVGNESVSCERNGGSVEWTWDQTKQHCQRNPCDELDPPLNGAMSCAAWLFGLICQMQCSEPYDIPYLTTNDALGASTGQFVCSESTGKWTPESVPDCSRRRNVDDLHVLGEFFYYTGECSNETVQLRIKDNFIENMKQMEKNGFSGVCPDSTECNVDNVVVTCGNVTTRRKRDLSDENLLRNKRSNDKLKVSFRINTKLANSSKLDTDLFQTMNDALKNVTHEIQKSVEDGRQNIDGLVADPQSLKVSQPKVTCPQGTFLRMSTLSCVPCSTGTFYSSSSKKCESCPVGTYKENETDELCSYCPVGTSTLATGTRNVTECIETCRPGYYSRTGLEPCSPCPLSTYQNGSRSTSCILCDSDETTLFMASQSEDNCTDYDYIFVDDGEINFEQVHTPLSSFAIMMWVYISSPSGISIRVSSQHSTALQFDYSLGEFKISTTSESESFNISIPEGKWTLLSFTVNFENESIDLYLHGEPKWNAHTNLLGNVSVTEWHASLFVETNEKVSVTGFNLLDFTPTELEMKQFADTCHHLHPRSIIHIGSVVNLSTTKTIKRSPSKCISEDPCAPNPCNGQSCTQVDNEFVCHCSSGYRGETCNTEPDYCANDPCENSVSCTNANGTFVCNCKSGYKGTRCTEPIINGGWSTWGQWSDCSASCEGGNRTRRRYCNNPPPGPDGQDCDPMEYNQTEACNTADCPTCKSIQKGYMNKVTCVITQDGRHECKVTCKMGYSFLPNQMPDDLYVCDQNTNYRWSNSPPSCSASKTPKSLSTHTSLTYKNMSCHDKSEVRKQVEDKAAKNYRCLKNKTCNMEMDVQGCTGEQSDVDVTITLTSRLESNLTLEPTTSLENASESVLKLLYTVSDLELSVKQLNESSDMTEITLNDVTYTSSAIETKGKVECLDGQGRLDATCVECPVGTFSQDSYCELCEYGSYQDTTGQSHCKPCPVGYTTDILGARDLTLCIEDLKTTVASTVDTTADLSTTEKSEVWSKIKDDDSTKRVLIIVFSVIAVVVVAVIFVTASILCRRHIYNVNNRKEKEHTESIDQSHLFAHQNRAYGYAHGGNNKGREQRKPY